MYDTHKRNITHKICLVIKFLGDKTTNPKIKNMEQMEITKFVFKLLVFKMLYFSFEKIDNIMIDRDKRV